MAGLPSFSSSTALEAALKILDIFIIALKERLSCSSTSALLFAKGRVYRGEEKVVEVGITGLSENSTTSRIRRRVREIDTREIDSRVLRGTHTDEIPVGGSATYPSCCRIPSLNIAVLYLLN